MHRSASQYDLPATLRLSPEITAYAVWRDGPCRSLGQAFDMTDGSSTLRSAMSPASPRLCAGGGRERRQNARRREHATTGRCGPVPCIAPVTPRAGWSCEGRRSGEQEPPAPAYGLLEPPKRWRPCHGVEAGSTQQIGGDLLAQAGCRRMSDNTAAVILALATENAELRAALAEAQDLLVETAINAGELHGRIQDLEAERDAWRAKAESLAS